MLVPSISDIISHAMRIKSFLLVIYVRLCWRDMTKSCTSGNKRPVCSYNKHLSGMSIR